MRFRAAIIVAGVCALFAACGEERHSVQQDDMIEPDDGKGVDIWLRATDHTEPALWLARREAGGAAVSERDPAVERIRAALLSARAHFLETDRMLANRTAQLGIMLAADGHAENFAQLIGSLVDVAAAAGQRQTYGELCQHYYNLRHSGVERDAALQMLALRYRTQRQFR
ncbi:MAG: hypothetical protein FJX45_05675 [Alphaproteobacteria bacterium]|nr:hypothetical protein [Alphaproteobacteria bacterium]MBM3651485.1 hypothetical protein [Alphaproteobacteria bacterium]